MDSRVQSSEAIKDFALTASEQQWKGKKALLFFKVIKRTTFTLMMFKYAVTNEHKWKQIQNTNL